MNLPKETIISSNEMPDDIYDKITEWLSNYLSDKFEYYHKGFSFELGDIKVSKIKWDTEN